MTLSEALQKAKELGIEVRIAQPTSRAMTSDMQHCFTEHWGDHNGSADKATVRVIERVIEKGNKP